MTRQLDQLEKKIRNAVEVDPATGKYRGDRGAFTDQDLFDLEMKHIFEGNWMFLAHESQMENPGDYFTLTLGRQPVVITRTKEGELQALLNTCTHRGATLCRKKRGNKSSFTCPFHGWTFRNDGKLLKARDQKKGGYPEQFNTEGSHDLKRPPSLGRSAGARLMVMRFRLGNSSRAFCRALRTLSLLSRTAVSGSPTSARPGMPLARCTSTVTGGA